MSESAADGIVAARLHLARPEMAASLYESRPSLGVVVAPLAPQAEHRAERRSMSDEVAAPHRITKGAIAAGAR